MANLAWLGPRRTSIGIKKALVSVVILFCLGAQTYAAVRPSGARWYPFIAYPMYSQSYPPGETYRTQELWSRACGDARMRRVEPRTLGYEDNHFLVGLGATAGDRPAALQYRVHLSELARTRLTPRPCFLQVLERTIPTTPAGVDASALRHPRRALLREWSVNEPGAVRTLPMR